MMYRSSSRRRARDSGCHRAKKKCGGDGLGGEGEGPFERPISQLRGEDGLDGKTCSLKQQKADIE